MMMMMMMMKICIECSTPFYLLLINYIIKSIIIKKFNKTQKEALRVHDTMSTGTLKDAKAYSTHRRLKI